MLCCSASTLTMPLSLDESWRVAWWMQAPGEEMLASYSILPQGATGSAGSQATVGLTVWRIVRTHRWHPRLALLPASAIKGVAAGPSQWNSADIGCSCSRCTKIYIYICIWTTISSHINHLQLSSRSLTLSSGILWFYSMPKALMTKQRCSMIFVFLVPFASCSAPKQWQWCLLEWHRRRDTRLQSCGSSLCFLLVVTSNLQTTQGRSRKQARSSQETI